MRLVWTTDPHFNHASEQHRSQWVKETTSHGADGVVISGDISEGDDVVFCLRTMAESLVVPIYFVLGNHDFYGGTIAETRRDVIRLCRDHRQLHYLTDCSAIPLGEGTYLLGEDGWGDATVGDFEHSHIRLNDFQLIGELRDADCTEWKTILHQLGNESAERLKQKLVDLPQDALRLLVVTHVPPFREACWYEGHTTDDNWAPFFVSGQVGNVLRQAAEDRPQCDFTVICGHTHHAGLAKVASNLVVHTGRSEYGRPGREGWIKIDENEIDLTRSYPGTAS